MIYVYTVHDMLYDGNEMIIYQDLYICESVSDVFSAFQPIFTDLPSIFLIC